MIRKKQITMQSLNALRTIDSIFKRDERIVLVYLFGSSVRGKRTPLSDIDIAYVVKRDCRFSLEDELALLGSVTDYLKTDEVDLVRLDSAPLSFQYSVIKEGRLIFCRDMKEKENYKSWVILYYLDFKPVRDTYFRYMQEHLSS